MTRTINFLLFVAVMLTALCAFAGTDVKNMMTVCERAGVSTKNYPVQVGRPFVSGEISGFPQVALDGTLIPTQADVKTRWTDGSVKHAIISFIIPQLNAGSCSTVTFQNQPTGNNAGYLDGAGMLSERFRFDAEMVLKQTTTQSASARTMISRGAFTYWLQGSISTSVIIADHSADRPYDMGSDSNRAFRPIFLATFWPSINKVKVRYVGEIANTVALQDEAYDLTLLAGSAPSTSVYHNSSVKHHAMTRWTREYWIGDAPPRVAVDHNLAYLSSTMLLPNYDISRRISESSIASNYGQYLASDREIFGRGNWNVIMGMAGGRPEIGPMPTWTVRWLYTGDPRMQEMALGNADLAGGWPMHIREGSDRPFTRDGTISGLGRCLSLSARKTVFLGDGNGYMGYNYTSAKDRLVFSGPVETNPWVPDSSHQPDAFVAQYLLTGDYWYLEQMYFWASWSAAGSNPGNLPYGRGPTGDIGGISDQVRGEAWRFRSRVETAALAPDGTPEKKYFSTLVEDAIAIWEGARGIRGTAYEGSPLWTWGKTVGSQRLGRSGASPLGWWEMGNTVLAVAPVNSTVASMATSPWMQHFMIYALARGTELGFRTTPLLRWAAAEVTTALTDPAYDPLYVAAYRAPTVRADTGQYFADWATTKSGFRSDFDARSTWQASLRDPEHGYVYIAMAATAVAADLGNADAAWSYMLRNVAFSSLLNDTPKWAIVPRRLTAAPPAVSPCDIDGDGSVSGRDLQLAVSQTIGATPCGSGDVDKDRKCNAIDIALVIRSLGGKGCSGAE